MLKMLLVVGLIAGALAVPAAGVAQAAEVGQVCNIQGEWIVARNSDGTGFLYYITEGQGFRITAFAGAYYRGHGNGLADGYLLREFINQATCHF
jgi:hypothetical protein